MVQARIRIKLADGYWKADVSRDHADLSFRLLGTVITRESAVETVVISGCTPEDCLPEMETHSDIEMLDRIEQHENEVILQLKTCEPVVHNSAAQAGIPLVYPAKLEYGELTTTLVGTHTAISSLGEKLEMNELEFEVASIQSGHDISGILTDRQQEVFFTAVEHGYYRNPRECTLTEVADILDIAKSTCSGTLQRAEAAVVEHFCVQQQFPGEDTISKQNRQTSGRSGG